MARSYPPRPRAAAAAGFRRMLYLGLALFLGLAAITVQAVRDEWLQAMARSRSEAVFELVSVATPTRPTQTPGAVSWLDLQIERYGRRFGEPEAAQYRQLVTVGAGSVPALLEPLRSSLTAPVPSAADAFEVRILSDQEVAEQHLIETGDEVAMDFRVQRFLDYQPAAAPDTAADSAQRFVFTRRIVVDGSDPSSGSNRFLRAAVPYLAAAAQRLQAPLPEVAGHQLKLLRVYALAEDGTFVSLPFPDPSWDEQQRLDIVRREGREFRKQPRVPSYVSNEFFFQFDFARAAAYPQAQANYSGLYLDLAGHGLVTTVTVPVVDQESGFLAVAAIDVALEIDWQEFARAVESPQVARLLDLATPPSPTGWRPWTELRRSLNLSAPGEDSTLSRVVAQLAEREQRSGYSAAVGSLYHGVVEGEGAVAVFQVAGSRWLVVLFPERASRFPWLSVALLVFLGLSLLAGFEINRQWAERAQLKAEGELQEKENLLNSMRVPMTVVDPNSDEVVYGNEAARSLGIEPGSSIGDLVADQRAREHYDRMQQLSAETRRAYGLPLRLRAADGLEETRHAVVRSAAVAAPIDTLQADERHRLGIFFVLEPEADLAIFAQDLERSSRDDERRRLAGLLAHGVDTLARVLAHSLDQGEQIDDFDRWLSDYLGRRLEVTAWLLEHWQAEPPLAPDSTVEAEQARTTLERFQRIFAWVRDDADLRARLHWNNGVLAAGGNGEVFEFRVDWPTSYLFTCPVRGGFGLFLEEVLVNAVRHGRPGSRPRVEIELDPVRRELQFAVVNDRQSLQSRAADDLKPYGGRRILQRLAHLFDWRDLEFYETEVRFQVSWRVQVGERAAPGESD